MLDSLAIEILTYCVIVGVKPSIIRDNFVRVEDERVDVFHPHDINYVNRVALRNLRSAYDSYRSRQFGGRSVSALSFMFNSLEILSKANYLSRVIISEIPSAQAWLDYQRQGQT
jgi:hypothetical protein